MIAGSLEIQLLANIARLQADMDQAKRVVGGAMGSIERAASVAKGALVGLGAVGLAAAFAASVKGAIDLADGLNKLSQRTGVAVENLSQLQYAAKLSDVSSETLTNSIRKLNISISEGLAGDEKKISLFKSLGITTSDLGKGTEAVMMKMADAYASTAKAGDKVAIGNGLMGKTADEMIPFLNGGSQAITALMIEADKLGLTISSQFAKDAEEFNDNLERIRVSSQKVSIAFAGEFVAGLGKAMKAMADAIIEGGRLAGVIAGLQALMTGDDRHKANVSIVKGAELVLAAENALDKARARGDSAQVARLENAVKLRREELAVFQNYAKSMDADTAAKAAAEKAAQDQREKAGALRLENEAAARKADAAARKAAAEAAAARKKELADLAKAEADALAIVQKVAEARQDLRLKEQDGIDAFMLAQMDAATASLKSVNERIQSLKDEEAAVALSTAQNISLAEAIEQVAVARLKEKQAGFIKGSEGWEAIERELQARRELLGWISGAEMRKASKDAAKDAADEWKKASDQINQSLSDALMDAFMSGKGFGKTFVDSIKSMFNTMVLRPVISAIVTGATGSLGITGTANASTGGSSLFSSASSLYSAGSSAYTVGSQVLGGTMGIGNAAGTLFANATTTGAGTALDALLATNGAFGTATAGAAGSTLAGLAAAAPYVAAFVAAAYVLDKYVVSQATIHQGGGSQYSAAGGLMTTGTWVPESVSEGYYNTNPNGAEWIAERKTIPGYMTGVSEAPFAGGFTNVGYDQAAIDLTTGISKGIVSLLDSTAATFGKTAGYTAATSFADDSSSDGAWGSLRIADAVGNVLTDWQASESFRVFGDGAAGTAEYQTAIATDVRAVLQNIDLPAWANDMLAALGDTPDLTSLSTGVAQINLVAEALDTMRDKLVGFAAMSDTTVSALIKASGGFEALATNASAYFDAFYTEPEKQAFTLAEVAKTLNAVNLSLPTTNAGFRALVEQQQALGNAEGVAALYKVAGAFASVIPMAEAAGDAVAELIGKTVAQIAEERADLQQTLDLLTGATTERAIERAALDDSNRSLYDQITALQDLQTAADESARASQEAADAMSAASRSVSAEAKRLRGELIGNSAGGQAYLTALFATTTGQARAGSVTAMEQLPEISQALEAAAALNATSSVDLARTRAWLANSLITTAGALPGDVFGTMPGTPAAYTATPAASTAQLEALVQKLTGEVEGLRAHAKLAATSAEKTQKILERLTPNGDALAVREAAAL